MKNTAWSALLLVSVNLVLAVCAASAQDNRHFAASTNLANAKTTAAERRRFLDAYAKLPLRFEANQGQTSARVRFLSRSEGYTLFLTPTEAVLLLSEPKGNSKGVVGMEWLGSKKDAALEGVNELPGKSNYFIGNDPKQWHVGVSAFGRVSYKEIYPGVDLVFYGNQRHLEYDFVIAPGGDPNAIKLKISGSRGLRVDKNGNLLVRVGSQDLQLSAPNVYQEEAGKKHAVQGRWIRSGRTEVRFALGAYDHSRTLVVDPTLSYSTYLGGSLNDTATAVALDSAGDAFITGATGSGSTASIPFPTTANAFQRSCNGCRGAGTETNNAFITKLDPTGTTLLYSTFLGGSNGDTGNGIAIDSSGNAYVVGTTFSSDFPTMKAFQTYQGNGDAFVTELNSAGSALLFSSFLGGSEKEEGLAIALDPSANVYVAGYTQSINFNVSPDAYQSTSGGGGQDAFVAEISQPTGDSNAALVYSTYLGGTGTDEANGIAVDASGDAYVVGDTLSANFPTPGGYQTACGGCANGLSSAFVTKFVPGGGSLSYSTFLGGTKYPTGTIAGDIAKGVAIDSSGAAYVVGQATSTDFPTKNAFQATCAGSCAGGDAFLTKVKPTGASLAYSTYLGGSAADQANGVAVDAVGNVFVTGETGSTDFPIENLNYSAQTACAACSSGLTDIFVAELDVAGNALVYSTYLGGTIPACQVTTSCQTGSGIAVGSLDQAVIAGWTESGLAANTTFPTLSTSYQPVYGGGVTDAVIAAFPAAANCTTTNSVSGLTLTATISCTGNFASGNGTQNVGFTWGDGTDTEYPGCTSPCQVSAGTISLSTTHTYSGTGTVTVTPVVTDASGTAITTTTFNVSFAPTITTQPASQTIESGLTATVTVVATGTAPLSYQWYQGASGTTTTPISGATSSSYTTPALTVSTSYWVQVSNSVGSVDSTAATITVVPVLMLSTTTLPSNNSGTAYPSTTLVATGGVPTYTWSIAAGSRPFPPGLSLSSGGVISGTPTADGTFDFTLQVTDSVSDIATANLSIAITVPAGAPSCTAPTITSNDNTNPLSVSATTNCSDSDGTTPSTTISWGDGTTSPGPTATHVYAFSTSAPNNCVAGTESNPGYCKHAVVVTATDGTNNLSATASACITLIQAQSGTTSAGQIVTQSGVATAPLGVPTVTVTYTCATVNGPNGPQNFSSNSYALSCNINSAGSSYQTTLSGTANTIQVAVQTTASGSARILRQRPARGEMGWLYAAFLALPGVVLLGTGAPRKKNRKGKVVQYAGLVLLAILMCGWLGCSSSSLSSPTPSGYATPNGSYSVGVVGTDSSGNTQSTITVGFTVGD